MLAFLALILVAHAVVVDGSNAEGEAFLKENAQKEGVVVLQSGLQYKVLQSGPEGGRRCVNLSKCV
jgi:FKBP-type peptidyl-prolyl cis-trans isomerase